MHAPLEELPFTQEEQRIALACLCEWYPSTFTLEIFRPHQPLKNGIDLDLATRCLALTHRERCTILKFYTMRVMYLQASVAGAARIDLDGNVRGEVSAAEAEHAAVRLDGIMARRAARRIEAVEARRAERIAAAAIAPAPNISTLKRRATLHLPVFRVAS
jgi:ProP effector